MENDERRGDPIEAGRLALDRLATAVGRGELEFDEFDRRSRAVSTATTVDEVWAAARIPERSVPTVSRTVRTDPGWAVQPQPYPRVVGEGRPAYAPGPLWLPVGRCGPGVEWRAWAMVGAINLIVWTVLAVTIGPVHFWPMWVIGPWGLVLLARTVARPMITGSPARPRLP